MTDAYTGDPRSCYVYPTYTPVGPNYWYADPWPYQPRQVFIPYTNVPPQSWECIRCHKVLAPHVNECDCPKEG